MILHCPFCGKTYQADKIGVVPNHTITKTSRRDRKDQLCIGSGQKPITPEDYTKEKKGTEDAFSGH